MPSRRPPVAQPLSKQPKLGEAHVLDTSVPALWKKHRDILPVSWMAAQEATEAFEYTKRDSIEAWCDRYVKDELSKGFWSSISRMCRVPQRAPLLLWLPCLEIFLGQHCVYPQYDSIAQSLAANIVMYWWDDGKLDVIRTHSLLCHHERSVMPGHRT